MKKYLFFITILCIIFLSCRKNQERFFQNEAVIEGINPCTFPCAVNCPCSCGNYYFHFIDTTYTDNIPVDNPAIFNFGPNTSFPVYVKVNWINTSRCGVTAIKITDFEKF